MRTMTEENALDLQAITEAEARDQLGRIVGSAVFRKAKKLRAFLQFAVDEAIAGRAQSISAPTIAVEVFGNGRDLDQKSESLVRVQARQLRLKLGQYYQAEGAGDPVIIDMPTGGYAVTIRRRHALPAADSVFVPHGARVITLILRYFDYDGADPALLEGIQGLRDSIGTRLTAFDFVAVSTNPTQRTAQSVHGVSASTLLLSASIREYNGQPRLSVSLHAATSELQLWSRTYVIDQSDGNWTTAISRHVAANVSAHHGPAIRHVLDVFEHQPDLADPVFHLSIRSLRYLAAPSADHNRSLQEQLEFELDRQPASAVGLSMAARLRFDAVRFRFRAERSELDVALQQAQRAVALNPVSCFAWTILAEIRLATRDFDRARAAINRALDLNRDDPFALVSAGRCFWKMGDFEPGVALTLEAIALKDNSPSWYHLVLVHEDIRLGQFDQAHDRLATIEWGTMYWIDFLEAVICAHLGNWSDHDRAVARLKTDAPWLVEAPVETLRKAGFPPAFKERVEHAFAMAGQRRRRV